MSADRHRGRAYYSPHPDTLLAFLSRGIHHLCEAPERNILNDERKRYLVEAGIRRDTEAEFEELPASKIDKLVAERLKSAQTRVSRAVLADKIKLQAAPALKPGNRRKDVPRHQPLRPQTLIVAAYCIRFEQLHPSDSRNAIQEKVAQHLSQGLRACDIDDGLEVWGVRSAQDAFWDLCNRRSDRGKVPMLRFYNRYQRRGKTHPWDRNFFELSNLVNVDLEDFGGAFLAAFYVKVLNPLFSMEAMYNAALASPEFRGLRGERLADAFDRVCGFGEFLDDLQTAWMFRILGIPEPAFLPNDAA